MGNPKLKSEFQAKREEQEARSAVYVNALKVRTAKRHAFSVAFLSPAQIFFPFENACRHLVGD